MVLFGKFEAEVKVIEPSEAEEEPLDFYQPYSKVVYIMKNIGYNFKDKLWQGSSNSLPSALKGKSIDYYEKTKRGLGYVSNSFSLASKFDDSICHNHSCSTLSGDSDYGIGVLFKGLMVNMASISHLDDDKDRILQSKDDPWIKHLNALWDSHFERCEPPTDNKLLQVNLWNKESPQPIFICEGL